MRDPTIGLADAGLDPAQLATLRGLEHQAAALAALRSRLADAIERVPVSAPSGWRGLAAVAFDRAVSELLDALALASIRLEDAVGDTRQAVSTLGGQVYG